MAKFKFPNSSFLNGEVSPKYYSRTEEKDYTQSCREFLNAYPDPQGGASRRPGSQFIAKMLTDVRAPDVVGLHTMIQSGVQTATTENPRRIIPFVTPDETYVLVLTVCDSTSISPIEFPPMYFIRTSDMTDFTNGVDSTCDTYVVSWITAAAYYNNTLPYGKVPQGWTQAQMNEIQYAQSGDTIILTHPDVPPVIIQRLDSVTFLGYPYFVKISPKLIFSANPYAGIELALSNTLDASPVPYTLMPFLDQNTDTSHTMTISNAAAGAGKTLTSSTAFFQSSHFGSFFKVTSGGVTGLAVVTAYISSTVVTVTVIRAFPGTGAYPNWEEAAWSDYRGWPRSVTFFQQRAIYGGNKHFPTTTWGSRIGNFQWLDAKGYADGGARTENVQDQDRIGQAVAIAYGTRANVDPFSAQLAANEASPIQWLSSDNNLILGTKSREWIGSGTDSSQALGPLNIGFSPQTAYGTTIVQPIRVGNGLIFIPQDGQRVREFVFNSQEDAYSAHDLNFKSEHMVRKSLSLYSTVNTPAISQLAYQDADSPRIWCIDTNGGLFACSRNRELDQRGWHFHKIGGTLSSETAKVIAICVVPRTEINATLYSNGMPRHVNDLYMLVHRTINSIAVCYLERIGPEFQANTIDNTSTNIDNKPIYCDSAKVKTLGAPGTAFSGYDHLEGETVECIVDGSYIGTKVVSSGVITLSSNATQLIAGLSYRTIVNPLYLEAGSIIGSAMGTFKKIDTLVMNFVRTVGAKFGKSTATADLETIDMRASGLAAGTATPLFTGQIEKEFRGGFEPDLNVAIVQDDPMPFHISGFFARGDTND